MEKSAMKESISIIQTAYIKDVNIGSSRENYSDWRLYIHENKDGRYVESPFQLSDYTDRNKITIKGYFDKIFFAEIRNQKLEELGI